MILIPQNNNSKILPMNKPIISTYSTEANMLAVFASDEQAMAWFFENYFQVFTNGRFEFSSYIDFWAALPWHSCPFFETYEYDLNFDFDFDVLDVFINAINDGFYVFLPLNQAYIEGAGFYGDSDRVHETFVYGYDLAKKIFYIADFFDQGYSFIEASFKEIKASYTGVRSLVNRNDALSNMILMKFKKNEKYIFDLNNYKKNINDYLLSKPTIDPLLTYRQYYFDHAKEHIFGMSVYDFLISLINKIYYADIPVIRKNIDFRGFHMMYEHKNLTLYALRYMIHQKYLCEESSFLDICTHMIDETLILRNLTLKFNQSKNEKYFRKMSDKILALKKADKDFTRSLLEYL